MASPELPLTHPRRPVPAMCRSIPYVSKCDRNHDLMKYCQTLSLSSLWIAALLMITALPTSAQHAERTAGFNHRIMLTLDDPAPERAAGVAVTRSDPMTDEGRVHGVFVEVHEAADLPEELRVSPQGRTLAEGYVRGGWISPPVAVPAEGADPFLGIAASWDADTPEPALVDIDFRTSADGRIWDSWIHSGYDSHTKADSERYHSNLIFADAQTRYIQYRMTVQRHESGEAPVLRDLILHFISPGATPDHIEDEIRRHRPGERRQRTGLPSRSDTANALHADERTSTPTGDEPVVYPLPEYVDRTIWGATLGLSNTASRSVTNVTHLIVHHSAGNTTSSDFAAVVRGYWNFHVNGRNWADIGYNWLVDANGVVYQGRAFNLDGNKDVIGAHFSGHNANTMGICVIGNYNNTMPTGEALLRLNEMLAWKASELEIDPLGRAQHYSPGGHIHRISGHRDSGIYTDCPGHQLYAFLPEVRQEVFDLLEDFYAPVDYHIPPRDQENGFETLAEAITWVNTVDELTSNIRFILTDDLDETGENLNLTRNFHPNTQLQIVPEAGTSPVITLDHPFVIGSAYVTVDGLPDHDGTGGSGGASTSGVTDASTNGTSLTFHYTGDHEPGSVLHIPSSSQHIRLRNLAFTRDVGLSHLPTAIATGTDTGEAGPANITVTGNTVGSDTAPFGMAVHVAAGIPSLMSLTGNTMHTRAGAIVFSSQGFDVEIRDNRIHNTGDGLETASAMTLRGGRFTIENNEMTVREPADDPGKRHGVHIEQVWNDYLLANNMIRVIPGDGASGLTTMVSGIHVDTDYQGSSGEVLIYHNSVHLEGHAGGASSGLRLTGEHGGGAFVDVRNNIFVNAAGNADGPEGALGLFSDSGIGWFAEANNWHVQDGVPLGYVNDQLITTLEDFRTATGDDLVANVPVAFVFGEEGLPLLLGEASKGDPALTGRGVPDVVPTDMLGNTRHPVFPYMGVHEPEPSLTPMLSGDYHIPQGEHERGYATLAEAFTDLNTNGAEGDFRFLIHDDLDETGAPLHLRRGDLSSGTRMRIVSAVPGSTVRIAHPLSIENTSFVTIDGGEERSLRFHLEDTESEKAILIAGTSTAVTLRDLDITHESGTGLQAAGVQVRRGDGYVDVPQDVRLEGLHIGSAEHPFRDGIRLIGNDDPVSRTRTDVTDSYIFASHRGISNFFGENNVFQGNVIEITGHHPDPEWYSGMELIGVRNSNIRGNRIFISGINTSTPVYSAGVNIGGNEGQHTLVNNMISITGEFENRGASQENRLYGVAVHRKGQGERYNLFHNTIHLGATGQTGRTAAIGWEDVEPGTEPASFFIINNIFTNRHGQESQGAYAWLWAAGEFRAVRSNLLDVAPGANIGRFEGDEAATLEDWQQLSGVDLNSRTAFVHYRSDRDLRLGRESEGDNRLAGSFLPAIRTDIFGNDRNAEAPYKGAWESLAKILTEADRQDAVAGVPTDFYLGQNHPNPFNPVTQIRYDLPEDAKVRLEVFTVTGQRIVTLVEGHRQAGSHTVSFDASRLASGVYVYRIQAGSFIATRQMTLIK